MLVLGIETSCDETAAAIVRNGRDVLSNVVYSQIAHHRPYGGVVPEIASRQHVEALPPIMEEAVQVANVDWDDIDAVAVTYGPGLASSLMIGLSAAKALATRLSKPLIGINHLEGHLNSVFVGEGAPLAEDVCPLVVLLVSGGHTCLVNVEGLGAYTLLGQTIDDAAGEALDKGATLLGLGYPGGPAIEKAAASGDPTYIRFPRGLERQQDEGEMCGSFPRELCFSFSGLKTALLYHLQNNPEELATQLPSIAASYQEAAFDALIQRTRRAIEKSGARSMACVGGVARNKRLRDMLEDMAREQDVRLLLAKPELCTDNGAMIAALAGAGRGVIGPQAMDLDVQPNLPLS